MRYFLLITTFFLAGTTFSQTSLTEGPKVNGIALGTTREEVVRRLGKPKSQSKRQADECVGGVELTLNYPGLTFKLWEDADQKNFSVGYFEVRSAAWNVSGAKIGDASAAIKKRFGTRTTQEVDSQTNLLTWYYDMDENISPGNTSFAFRRGRVYRIATMYLMC